LRDFDVIVAGGGCAGLWAAFTAAGRGASTLVVEKEGGIGDRIRCAEGVGARGISRLVEIEDSWVASTVHGGRFCSPDGNCVSADEPGCGFVLHKDLFLKGLAGKANDAGAEIRTGVRVVELRRLDGGGFEVVLGDGRDGAETATGGRLTCRTVIAADGIQSGVARLAGVDTHVPIEEVFVCAQHTVAQLDLEPGFVEFHFGSRIAPGGYAWVFPKGDGRANVGVGIRCGAASGRAHGYLQEFMKARCPGARIERSVVGGVPAVRKPPGGFHNGLFIAGDAARAADPVSGAGIVPAMESAGVSGEFAAVLASGEMSPGELQREFKKKYDEVMKWRRLRYGLKKVFTGLTDAERSRMVGLIGQYCSSGGSLQAPGKLVKFFVKSMPRNFGMLRHLVGA
jgi:digeranylgeranylglycerophospholipid reductase